MVMAAPRTKLSARMSHRRRDFVIFAPMRLPMRLMDMSAPRVNSPIPTISSSDPMRNESISPVSTGTRARHKAATMTVTGRTEAAASFIFSLMAY